MTDHAQSLAALGARYQLPASTTVRLGTLAEEAVAAEISGTAIKRVGDALDRHIADSLVALELPQVRAAAAIADIGAGIGFPGLVLAAALPASRITLIDGVRKKMDAAAAIARRCAIANAECVWGRVEEIAAPGSPRREVFDVVTARALAPLAVLIEYAAPLLRVGGTLVAWKSALGDAELADAHAAEAALGFADGEARAVTPFAGAERRTLYVTRKRAATPDAYPRRPGAASRKPIAAESR